MTKTNKQGCQNPMLIQILQIENPFWDMSSKTPNMLLD